MNSTKLWFLLAVLCAGSVSAFAQTNVNEEQGMKPYDSFHGGDLDSISMSNGGLLLHIPLLSFPQRGNLDLSFALYANTKQWQLIQSCVPDPFNPGDFNCANKWEPLGRGGYLPPLVRPTLDLPNYPLDGPYVTSSVDLRLLNVADWLPVDPNILLDITAWSGAIVSPDGAMHQLGTGTYTGFGTAIPSPLRSLDATGFLYDGGVVLPNGTHYLYPSPSQTANGGLLNSGPTSVTDANGNQITINGSTYTDTLGRVIPGPPGTTTSDLSSCPAGTSTARVWSVPGLSGGSRPFELCYSNVSIYTTFGGGTDYPPTNTPLLTAIVLPDLTIWTLAYDHLGDVTRLGFPTGGSVSYEYAVGPSMSGLETPFSMVVTSRTVDANDGTGGHKWDYNFTGQYVNSPNGQVFQGKMVVTSPDLNDTVHTITNPIAGMTGSLLDTQVQYYQGSQSSGTLLKTVARQYTGVANPFAAGTAMNVLPTQTTTTTADGHTSRIVSTFDTGENVAMLGATVIFGSLLQRDEYDFSNTLARSTFNHYRWQDNSTYKDSNFLGLQVSSILKNGAGCEMAKSSNGYDETFNSITLQSSGVTTQHGSAPWSVRGNHTSSSSWLISGCAEQSAITSHTIPYDTGFAYQSYDPLGHFTQYTYSSAFAGAYLTQTNLPDTQMPDAGAPVVHHVISGNYDFNTGLLINFTDENGQPYSYQYDSLMLRLTQGNHPDGGITKFFYPDPNTVERQRLITATTYDDFKVKFDGVGRPYQTLQFTPDCIGWIKVDTGYDSVGRTKTVSNPYCLTSEPTYGITTTIYDALSRTLNTTKQDGSVTSVKYEDTPGDTSGATLTCTTATDESGKKRQACSDAFGRLVKVIEPNPASVATNATGLVTISGSEQTTGASVSITVANYGFETPVLGSGANAYQYHPTGSGWTFGPNSGVDSNNNVVGGSGITGNNSGFTSSNPSAPQGAQVAFLQGGSANFISQSLSGFLSGVSYTVSFQAAQRGNFNTGGQDFDVYLDSTLLATFRPASTSYALLSTPAFSTTAGTHTLKFVGRDSAGGNGNAAFIDAVQVTGAVVIPNSGFEAPALGASNFQYNPTGGSWTFGGGTGISANGSGFTSGNPGAPEGSQVAFIQMGSNGVFSQSLSGFQTGVSYTVSFSAAQRGNASNGGQDFDVYLDSTLLGTFRPAGTNYSTMSTAAFTTTAGMHALRFVGRDSAGGDNTAFIDAVQISGTVGIADAGTVTVSVNGTPYSTSFGAGDTSTTIASRLATAISAGSYASATASGPTINLTSKTTGTTGDYSLTASYTWNSGQFTNSSFTTSTSGSTLSGAKDAAGITNNPFVTIYQYNVRDDLLCVHQKATDTTADVPCTGASAPSVPATWRQRFFTYDSLSRLLTAMNPEMNSTGSTVITYGYDNASRLTSRIEPAPNAAWGSSSTSIINYSYDALNRLLDTTYSDGTTLKASHRYDYATFQGQSFTNPIGREVAGFTVDTSGSTVASTFASYDVMGRVANTVQCNPSVSGCKTLTASYDKLGDLTTLAYPGNGFTVTYGYDSAARLTTATDSNGVIYAQTPTYFASGGIQEFTSPNFANNKYHVSYNKRLQPIEIWAGSAQGSFALFDKQYSYGTTGANNGNIYTITNVKDSSRTQSFTYDPLNRLITAGDNGHWANSYTYDAWGNLTNKTPGSPAGENMNQPADSNNHLGGLTYDAAGNVKNDGLGGAFVFDGENRIKTAGSVAYSYDADGRRIQKSTGTNYWYGPSGAVLAETDSVGNWTNYIFFGGQRLARNIPQPSPNSADIKYYITDHMHSTAMFVDKAGNTAAILDDNDMYPWGGVVPGVGRITSTNTIKFTGQYRDTDTGANLDYFGARYYSNTVGRFMSPDWAAKPTNVPYGKFGDPQSLNLYSYVENGPINRIDADGHNYAGWNGAYADTTGGFTEMDSEVNFEAAHDAETINRTRAENAAMNHYPEADPAPADPAPKGPYIADLKSKEIAPLLDPNHKPSNADVVGPNGECVDLTKKFSGMVEEDIGTYRWRPGPKVVDNKDIKPGTAIATFNDKGRYPSEHHWNSGIYLGSGGKGSFWILDQWPGHSPMPREVFHNDSRSPADNSAAYSVIYVVPR